MASDIGEVWVDAQLPPLLARRMRESLGLAAKHVFDAGLHTASDTDIFAAARKQDGIVVTKDVDFVHLLERHGPPPRVIWVTVGNVGNPQLWQIIEAAWPRIAVLLEAGERLVELSGRR